MIVAATGHRPKKLARSITIFEREIEPLLLTFTKAVLTEMSPSLVLQGMTVGFDLVVGQACIDLGIPFWACVPHRSQPTGYPEVVRYKYMRIFEAAQKRKLIVKGKFNMGCFDLRNEFMVDRCNKVLALWDGSESGTGNCVKYAISRQKPLDDVWDRWERFRDADLSDIL